MVSVPPSPGRMPARVIMEHLLATMVSLPASPLSFGQATVIFLYRLLTQHQKIRKKMNNS
jgi:hypothetical protein